MRGEKGKDISVRGGKKKKLVNKGGSGQEETGRDVGAYRMIRYGRTNEERGSWVLFPVGVVAGGVHERGIV